MFEKMKNMVMVAGMLRILLGLVQPIKDLIEIAEEMFADMEKAGPEKKEAVLEILDVAFDTVSEAFSLALPKKHMLAFADGLITVLVAIYNARGFFVKKDEVPPSEDEKKPLIDLDHLR